jgi:catechol 2,3-dioxygenase-like lactoylglutathione lyase family enzyme
MKLKTEAQVQRVISLEIALIIVGIGADMLIETLRVHDWIAGAVIVAGFCIIGGLYWHTLYLDRLFADLHVGLRRILPRHAASPAPQGTPDIPVAAIADRPVIRVSNFLLSKNFYAAVLAPLGYHLTVEFPALSMAAFGIDGASDLWIKGDAVEQKMRAAFSASTKGMVDDFCSAAIAMGASVSEAPGVRPDRGSGYYAAAVIDPDGYTIEAVFRDSAAM